MPHQHVEIDGHRIRVTNLGKVLYPATGFTKAELIDYYTRIAPAMLPHLRGRPVTLKRYPNGVAEPFFFEKNCPSHRPPWVPTATVRYNGQQIEHCLIESRAALAWAANLGAIELHTSMAYAARIERPSMVVFDLDPGEGVGIQACAEVALVLRDTLEGLKLRTLAKLSGGKGLHVYLPLNPGPDEALTYEHTRPFAQALAKLVQQQLGGRVTTNMSKAERRGKVFIDWSQNALHKTTVCVYAMRATQNPKVSAPIDWVDVAALADSGMSEGWTRPADVIEVVNRTGDKFANALKWHQTLPIDREIRPGYLVWKGRID